MALSRSTLWRNGHEPNERLWHEHPPRVTLPTTLRWLPRTGLTLDVEQQLLKWKARPATKL